MVAARVLDISVRFASHTVFVSAVHGVVEIRELQDHRPGPLLHRYSIAEVEEVQLFVMAGAARKVLRLKGAVGVDLGECVTLAAAVRDAREVSRVVDRQLTIQEAAYQDVYFANDAPLLHLYEDGAGDIVNAPTVRFHRAYDPTAVDDQSEAPTLQGDVNLADLM